MANKYKFILVIIGILFLTSGYKIMTNSKYEAQNISFNKMKKEVSQLESGNDKFILIAERDSCSACQHSERNIMLHAIKNEIFHNNKVIVIDIDSLSTDQLAEFKNMFPQVLDNGMLPTPLVAQYKYNGSKWNVQKYSNTSNSNEIRDAFIWGDK